MEDALLEVRDGKVALKEGKQLFYAVKGVSLSVKKGRNLGLIGESGCGKTLLCHSILGLLDKRKWQAEGEFLFEGEPLLEGKGGGRPGFGGKKAGFIAQDPAAAFDPRMRLEGHFSELSGPLSLGKRELRERAVRLLLETGLREPERVLKSYSFQLSGGMLQRAMIALSLMGDPGFLIADEPTTALDATTRGDILSLLKRISRERGLTVLMVSHDLRSVARLAEDICVMYAGYVVEQGAAEIVLSAPAHPYTAGLLASRPSFSKKPVQTMEGSPPGIFWKTSGCPFWPRCPRTEEKCRSGLPELRPAKGDPARLARCFFAS